MINKLLYFLILFLASVSSVAKDNKIPGRVTWVKDGDSFMLRSNGLIYEVRMYGIDAPEYAQIGGKSALNTLIKFIKNKNVIVLSEGKDQYGRLVGKVYIGKIYINLEMVKKGQAHWYKKYAPKDEDFKNAESAAIKAKRGLWSYPQPVLPSIWRKTHRAKSN